MSNELWDRYCSFYEKTFSEQVQYNQQKLDDHFVKWKKGKMAERLGKTGVTRFEDIPLTTYDDYPILQEFGEAVEKQEKKHPRKKGEPIWDYYQRISQPLAPMLDGWLMDEYALCLKTSGSTGKSKWFVHGKSCIEACTAAMMPMALFACSDEWGKPVIEEHSTALTVLAPLPYGSGMAAKLFADHFEIMPPMWVQEEVTDMRKKIALLLKYVEDGTPTDFVISSPSTMKMVCDYFTNPEQLWKDRYQSMPVGIGKLVLYIKYLQSKSSRKYVKARDILPIKGLIICGWDGTIYLDYLRDQFNIEPFNLYAISDICLPLMGRPHRKWDMFPNLSIMHYEFLDGKGEIKKIQELSRNVVYELVATVFGSCPTRYRVGDLFRVVDFEADGTPIFRFEGRTVGLIDICNYYRMSEALARDALSLSGFHSENWAICHEVAPKERLKFLLEKDADFTEEQLARRLFEALRKIFPDFECYVRDFKVNDPGEAIEVEYLKKGAFLRYMMRKQKEGVSFGQIKPPKVIGDKQHDLAELLRNV